MQPTEADFTLPDIAKMIDHSLLKPFMTHDEIMAGVQLALDYDVASVCLLPCYLAEAAELLAGSSVQPSTTIGFPHGANATATKVAEARQALDDGGTELDMVANISKVLSGQWDDVEGDIKAIVDLAHERNAKVKVIFENCFLEDAHKIRLCEICGDVRADWVKTSTGFGTGRATLEDLALMRKHSPEHVQVKAAGGVRDLEMVLKVRAAGVTRFGCTATVAVLEECKQRLGIA